MPTPRSSRGRSPGSTQTSGLIPMPPASATRSRATAPSDRSITVTSPPVASRAEATMVSRADQPASVPPATSTRSIPSGSATGYHSGCRANICWQACQPRNRRACSSSRPNSWPSWSARAAPTRRTSAATVARRSRWPRQMARPPRPARITRPAAPRMVSAGFSRPAWPSTSTSAVPARLPPASTFQYRVSSLSSRRCAASQPGLSCSCPGGTGRRGGGPGSG